MHVKRKLLFIIPSLAAGGGERSLVSLLTAIDYDEYEVDLFLLQHDGIFMEQLPEQVNIVPLSDQLIRFMQPLRFSLLGFLVRGDLLSFYSRMMYTLTNRGPGPRSRREQRAWKYMVRCIPEFDKHYDAAIGFLEKTSIYCCVDKVKADCRIGWIHSDYDQLNLNPDFDRKYFERLDHLVTVSEECSNILKRRFPEQESKMSVVYNIISPSLIEKMAEQALPAGVDHDQLGNDGNEIRLLTVARLTEVKGIDIAIDACHLLIQEGYRVIWDVIGDGEERERLTKRIHLLGLDGRFRLLGLKTNPYPYIRHSDIYVHPSRYEGKSIAIDEAKILRKPMVITNYSTVKDQVTDGVDALIAEIDARSVADAIIRLIRDTSLKQHLIRNLTKQKLGTEGEIYKLYRMIGGLYEDKAALCYE